MELCLSQMPRGDFAFIGTMSAPPHCTLQTGAPHPRGFSLRISHAVDRSYHQHFRVRRLHRPCEPSLDQLSGGLIATSDEMDRYVPSQKHYPLVLSPLFPGSGRAPAPGVLLLSVNSGFACGPAAGVFEDC